MSGKRIRWTRAAWKFYDECRARGMSKEKFAALVGTTQEVLGTAIRARAGRVERVFSATEDALIRKRRLQDRWGWAAIAGELRCGLKPVQKHGIRVLHLPEVINRAQQEVSQGQADLKAKPPGHPETWGLLLSLTPSIAGTPYPEYRPPIEPRRCDRTGLRRRPGFQVQWGAATSAEELATAAAAELGVTDGALREAIRRRRATTPAADTVAADAAGDATEAPFAAERAATLAERLAA